MVNKKGFLLLGLVLVWKERKQTKRRYWIAVSTVQGIKLGWYDGEWSTKLGKMIDG